jgi:hypothetical protein
MIGSQPGPGSSGAAGQQSGETRQASLLLESVSQAVAQQLGPILRHLELANQQIAELARRNGYLEARLEELQRRLATSSPTSSSPEQTPEPTPLASGPSRQIDARISASPVPTQPSPPSTAPQRPLAQPAAPQPVVGSTPPPASPVPSASAPPPSRSSSPPTPPSPPQAPPNSARPAARNKTWERVRGWFIGEA